MSLAIVPLLHCEYSPGNHDFRFSANGRPLWTPLCGPCAEGCAGVVRAFFEHLAIVACRSMVRMRHAWLFWLCGCPPWVQALASDALNESEIGHRFCNPCSSCVWFPGSVDNMWDDGIQGPGGNFQLQPFSMNQMNQSVVITQNPQDLSECYKL